MTRGKTETKIILSEGIPPTLKKKNEFQTWSNLWCFEISQVTWIKIFCQQTACTLIQKRNSLGSIPSMLLTSLCSITTRPWGHHHQFRILPKPAVWSFGWCAKHQPRPEKNGSVKRLPNSFLDPKKGLRQSRICLQKMASAAAQSQQSQTKTTFSEGIPHTLKNRFEFQTWSNLWCFEISQVTWIKIFCQQTAFTLIQKRNSLGSIPSMLLTSLCSITTRPWGHHRQFCYFPKTAVWSFGSCAKHQPRPEKQMAVSNTFQIHLWTPRRVWGNPVFVYKYATAAAQSQITISNLEVRELYRNDCMTNRCRSKIVSSRLYWIVVPECRENWIHAHRGPKRMNFSQQLIVQQDLSLRCP